MSKNETKYTNHRLANIFGELEHYLTFCREFGYRYDEAELYNQRSFAYRQFQKFQQGKAPKDMWAADSKGS